ncbi:MAG: hypothetical protein ACRCWJ_18035 [Casimicrobium sp.]
MIDDWAEVGARRMRYERFEQSALEKNIVFVLCLEHLIEMFQYPDLAIVRHRINFIVSRKFVGLVRASNDDTTIGSIIDLNAFEISVLLRAPSTSEFDIRREIRNLAITIEAGANLSFLDRYALEIHNELAGSYERRNEVASIVHANPLVKPSYKLKDISDASPSNYESMRDVTIAMRTHFKSEVQKGGLTDSETSQRVVDDFVAEVFSGITQVSRPITSKKELVREILRGQGLDESAINTIRTIEEAGELVEFQRKFALAASYVGLDWNSIRRNLDPSRVPSWRVQRALKRHRQGNTESKGSELTDRMLASYAPYMDFTFVDKRVLENLRRASRKEPDLSYLETKMGRASHYLEMFKVCLEKLHDDSTSHIQ